MSGNSPEGITIRDEGGRPPDTNEGEPSSSAIMEIYGNIIAISISKQRIIRRMHIGTYTHTHTHTHVHAQVMTRKRSTSVAKPRTYTGTHTHTHLRLDTLVYAYPRIRNEGGRVELRHGYIFIQLVIILIFSAYLKNNNKNNKKYKKNSYFHLGVDKR